MLPAFQPYVDIIERVLLYNDKYKMIFSKNSSRMTVKKGIVFEPSDGNKKKSQITFKKVMPSTGKHVSQQKSTFINRILANTI